jgi:hypothetical protein
VTGELALADGVPVLIGAAKLSVDYERAAAAPAKSPRARAVRERDAEGGQERVQRTRSRATRSAGLPGWLTAVVILAIVAVAFFLVKNSLDSGSDTGSIDELTSKNRIEDSLLNGEFKGALLELDRVERKPDLAPEWRRAFQVLRQKAEAASGSGAEAARNAQGTPYLETQLKKFVSGRLLKDPSSRPKARVFMKRARWWIEQFPTHPERDWVDRHVARYQAVAALHEPSTFEDASFEIEALTWAYPADYKQAFKVLAEFRARATEEELGRLDMLAAELRTTEQEYFDEKFDEAQNFWSVDKTGQRKNPGKAVERLVQLVIKLDNQDLANRAASTISKMESSDESILGMFRGYRNDRPDKWAALLENSIVRRFLEEKEVL